MIATFRVGQGLTTGVRCLRILLAISLCLAANIAEAVELRLSGFTTQRFNTRANFRDTAILYNPTIGSFDTTQYLKPRPVDLYYSGFIELSGTLELAPWFTFTLTANSGEVRRRALSLDGTTTLTNEWTANGRLVRDEVERTLFIRDMLLTFEEPDSGWWQVHLGRKLWRIADSLIYDDFGLGLGTTLDFNLRSGVPFAVHAAYIIPSRDIQPLPITSPFVTLSFDYIISFFERLSVGAAYFYDGESALSETFRQGFVESVLTLPNLRRSPQRRAAFEATRQRTLQQALSANLNSQTHLGYAFSSLTKTVGPGTLKATAVGSFGRSAVCTARSSSDENDGNFVCLNELQAVTLLGFALDVAYRWSITERLQLTPFVVLQSGSNPVTRGQSGPYGAYIGVLPFLTRTNLFFAGGLNETFGARQLTAAGVNGRGVLAPGATLIADPLDSLRLRATAALLSSLVAGPRLPIGGGGMLYGVELDGVVDFRPWDFVGFVAEGDVLFAGSFYGTADPVVKVILGIDLSFNWDSRDRDVP